eukprot:c12944_g1_i1 orf=1-273(-)
MEAMSTFSLPYARWCDIAQFNLLQMIIGSSLFHAPWTFRMKNLGCKARRSNGRLLCKADEGDDAMAMSQQRRFLLKMMYTLVRTHTHTLSL